MRKLLVFIIALLLLGGCATSPQSRVVDLTSPSPQRRPAQVTEQKPDGTIVTYDFTR